MEELVGAVDPTQQHFSHQQSDRRTGPTLSDKSLTKSVEILCVDLAGTQKTYLYVWPDSEL